MRPPLTLIPLEEPFHRMGVDVLQLPLVSSLSREQVCDCLCRLPNQVARGLPSEEPVSVHHRQDASREDNPQAWCPSTTPFRLWSGVPIQVVGKDIPAHGYEEA